MHWCNAPAAPAETKPPVPGLEEVERLRKLKELEEQRQRIREWELKKARERNFQQFVDAAGGRSNQAAADETNVDEDALRADIVDMISTFTAGLDEIKFLQKFGVPATGNLKVAYRKSAMRFHPDKNRQAGIKQRIFAEEAFKAIAKKLAVYT